MSMSRSVFAVVAVGAFFIQETPAAAQPVGLAERVPNNSLQIEVGDNPLAAMELRRVFAGTWFDEPVFLTHAGDGSGRLFVVERKGRIRVLEGRETTEAPVFLDLSTAVNSGPQEAGLLGLAFHPAYAENGLFYVYYTHGALVSRLAEFRVSEDPYRADPGSERVVLEVEQPAGNHNGGQIDFGHDGFLYWSLGDGGAADDVFGNGQNQSTLLGAMLRLDVDGRDGGRQYAVPADNPFVGNNEGWREEIWAWGLRNGWRFSIDRLTGELWAGDVGQNRFEEISVLRGGGNYGWNIMEGFDCFSPASGCEEQGLEKPVFAYDHSEGRSITGGYVYRGARLRRLDGVYLYADFVSRRVWGLRRGAGDEVENLLLAVSPGNVSSFGEDEAGEVYVVTFGGEIYVFDEKPDNPPALGVPRTISASGLYRDMETLETAPGIVPYGVNAQLWSDGAFKERYMALPGEERIAFSAEGPWGFPDNTVLVKNFFLDMVEGDPSSRQIIETRFLVKRTGAEGWDGFSYMWDDEGGDAVLLDDDSTKVFFVEDASAPGGVRLHEHLYPSRQDCGLCHNPGADYVLGVRTDQLNGELDYGGARDNQLRALNHAGFFDRDIAAELGDLPRLADPFDPQADLDARARAYLQANCAQCHPGAISRTILDMRAEVSLEETNMVDNFPTLGSLGAADPRIIKPGAPEESTLYLRMLDLDTFRMPSIATSRVDTAGAELIRRWILALGGITAVEEVAGPQPERFELKPNHPNPFNASTTLEFSLTGPGRAELALYDLLGRQVRVLEDKVLPAGRYRVSWDGRDAAGRSVGSGIYFGRLLQNGRSATQKMVLVK